MTFIKTIISLLSEEVSCPSDFISCPICAKKLNYHYSEYQQIIICEKCELGVTAPPPESALSIDAILETQYNKDRENKRAQWINKAVKRLDWLHLWLPEGTILEIGSGFGEFLEVATNMGHDCFGIEASCNRREKTEKLCNTILFDSFNEWELNSKDLAVDAIAAWYSIEKMMHPLDTLSRAHKTLRKDGYFFAEVPNLNCYCRKKYMGEWRHANLAFNHYHYSTKSIKKLFRLAGFEIIHSLEMTSRIYSNHIIWKRKRNQSLIRDDLFPDNELLRIVARKI